jgi:rubredoxin
MSRKYQCNICGTIFDDDTSDKFVKTVMKKCPVCGSSKVSKVSK